MKTKKLALLTLAALLIAGAASAFALTKKPVAETETTIDCELVITPKGTTVVKGGDFC